MKLRAVCDDAGVAWRFHAPQGEGAMSTEQERAPEVYRGKVSYRRPTRPDQYLHLQHPTAREKAAMSGPTIEYAGVVTALPKGTKMARCVPDPAPINVELYGPPVPLRKAAVEHLRDALRECVKKLALFGPRGRFSNIGRRLPALCRELRARQCALGRELERRGA